MLNLSKKEARFPQHVSHSEEIVEGVGRGRGRGKGKAYQRTMYEVEMPNLVDQKLESVNGELMLVNLAPLQSGSVSI